MLNAPNVDGAIIASSNFSTFTNGNLVGQNGWQQYNTPVTVPIQVSSGAVTWTPPAAAIENNQDAFLPFPSQIAQPSLGSIILNYDVVLSVASAGAPGSFFAALNTLTDGTLTNNFQNARLAVQPSGAGFVVGSRVNGQGGYPFAFGTEVLNFNQSYALRAEINMVAGNSNDFIRVFAGNDFNNLTLQATATATSTNSAVTDPLYGSIILSQFQNATAFQPGVTINSVSVSNVTAVPEPSSFALIGFAITGTGCVTYRRRCKCA